MNVALQRPMTTTDFLAWDATQEKRWEFDGFQPVAMVGRTLAHQTICLNVGAELRARLRGGPCRAIIEGLKINPAGSIRYPDILVHCGPIANEATIAENPVVVFEVLSPSTASTDTIVKNREYRATPSISRYIVLAQDRIAASVHHRHNDDWLVTSITDPTAILEMPEINISLPLAACYEGVLEHPETA